MSAPLAPQTVEMGLGETIPDMGVSFDRRLRAGVTLTGTPVVTITAGGPTISNPQVNSSAVVLNGKSVPAGKAVLFKATGAGSVGQYQITVTVTTSNSGVLTAQLPLQQI